MSVRFCYSVILMPLVVGCEASPSTVVGTVTIDGHPLQDGYITFFPTEGSKNVCGAKVIDGRYQIEHMPAGSRRVLVAGTPDAVVNTVGNGPPTLRFVPTGNYVAPRAAGNQQVVQIHSGSQTLNFALVNPKISAAR